MKADVSISVRQPLPFIFFRNRILRDFSAFHFYKVNVTHSSELKTACADYIFYPAVPPDILDYPTSTDMVVREGINVSLRCEATGSPTPNITWRREDGELINFGNSREKEGKLLTICRVRTKLNIVVLLNDSVVTRSTLKQR